MTTPPPRDTDTNPNLEFGEFSNFSTGMVLLFLLIFAVLFVVLGYFSGKGFCKWTKHDTFWVYTGKSIANAFTGGILGIVFFFTLKEDKKDKRRKNKKKVDEKEVKPVGKPGSGL